MKVEDARRHLEDRERRHISEHLKGFKKRFAFFMMAISLKLLGLGLVGGSELKVREGRSGLFLDMLLKLRLVHSERANEIVAFG